MSCVACSQSSVCLSVCPSVCPRGSSFVYVNAAAEPRTEREAGGVSRWPVSGHDRWYPPSLQYSLLLRVLKRLSRLSSVHAAVMSCQPRWCFCHFHKSKKLSCRSEAARRSLSLKILLNDSRSSEVVWNYIDITGRKFLLVIRCNYVSILYCFRDIQRRIVACPWNQGSFKIIRNSSVYCHLTNSQKHRTPVVRSAWRHQSCIVS